MHSELGLRRPSCNLQQATPRNVRSKSIGSCGGSDRDTDKDDGGGGGGGGCGGGCGGGGGGGGGGGYNGSGGYNDDTVTGERGSHMWQQRLYLGDSNRLY